MFVGEADENIVQHFACVYWLTSLHREYIFQRRMFETLSSEEKLLFKYVWTLFLQKNLIYGS